MSELNTVYLIHASDATQHVTRLRGILDKLLAEKRIGKIATIDPAADWALSKPELTAGDLVIVLLTLEITPHRREGEAYLKRLATEVQQLRLMEIIVDSVPYDEAFQYFPTDGNPIRDSAKMDQIWDGIENKINEMFRPMEHAKPKTKFQNYGPYAAGLVVILILIWLTPKLGKRPNAAFTFKVQDAMLKEKKAAGECYQPCLVSFYDESKDAESLTWNMGDTAVRNYPSDRYPEHLFTAPGTYHITLTAAAGRKTNIVEHALKVKPTPIAGFDITNNGCVSPCTVTLQNKSQHATKFDWKVADTTYSADKNPAAITYNAAGTYKVHLTVFNADGLQSDTDKTITIKQDESPFAQFTSTWAGDATHKYRRKFRNTSKFADKYVWQFGDGTNKVSYNGEMEFVHDFPNLQTFAVVLTAQKSGAANPSLYGANVYSGKEYRWAGSVKDILVNNQGFVEKLNQFRARQQ